MYSASAEFTALVQADHTSCAKVDVTFGGSDAVEISSADSDGLELLEGTIKIDRQADTRRTASLKFGDSEGTAVPTSITHLTEMDWFDPLSYYEFRPYRGVVLSSGAKEFIPQGVLYIDKLQVDEDEGGAFLNAEVSDRSKIISENEFTTPYNIASGTNYTQAIKDLITSRANHFSPIFNFAYSPLTTPNMTFDVRDDPWQSALKLAEAIGMELFFGLFGELILQPVPDPDQAEIVASYKTDPSGVRISPLSRAMERATARSGVKVRGSAPWLFVPVEAAIWDEDPLSVTYRYGRMGDRAEIIDDALVTNTAMAKTAAQGKFNSIVGIVEEIEFNALVDPRLDTGDVIEVNSDKSGVEGKYVLEQLSLPLDDDRTMTGNTRRRRRA